MASEISISNDSVDSQIQVFDYESFEVCYFFYETYIIHFERDA